MKKTTHIPLYYPLEIDEDLYICLGVNGLVGFFGEVYVSSDIALNNYLTTLVWGKVAKEWMVKDKSERVAIIHSYWVREVIKIAEHEAIEAYSPPATDTTDTDLDDFEDLEEESEVAVKDKVVQSPLPLPTKITAVLSIIHSCLPYITFSDYGQRRLPTHLLPPLAEEKKLKLSFVLKFVSTYIQHFEQKP